jgi:hypothetical protein
MKIQIPDDVPSELHERFMDFWRGYTQAVAFTSSVDDEDGQGGQLFVGSGEFNENYPDSWDMYAPLLSTGERHEMIHDAAAFFMEAQHMIDGDDCSAGSDFHYTRNGHGAGFWDGDWEEHGDTLTAMSRPYGTLELYGTLDENEEIVAAYLCH